MLSSGAFKRLVKEEEMLMKSADDEGRLFKAYPSIHQGNKNYKVWDIYFTLSGDSLYSGKIIKATMEFPDCYPLQPPTLKFISKMFHPNIYNDGRVCISILEEDIPDPTGYGKSEDKWAPVQNIRTVLLSIVVVINSPNIESPANVDASVMFRENIEKYNKTVRELARSEDEKLRNNDPRTSEVALIMEAEKQDNA